MATIQNFEDVVSVLRKSPFFTAASVPLLEGVICSTVSLRGDVRFLEQVDEIGCAMLQIAFHFRREQLLDEFDERLAKLMRSFIEENGPQEFIRDALKAILLPDDDDLEHVSFRCYRSPAARGLIAMFPLED